jgi:hypothetical protein
LLVKEAFIDVPQAVDEVVSGLGLKVAGAAPR